jgi:hypothetical protein
MYPFLIFPIFYSILLLLPPLGFHCVARRMLGSNPEPEFLNFYGAQESISISSTSICNLAGRYDKPTWFLAPIDCLKIPALDSCDFGIGCQTLYV